MNDRQEPSWEGGCHCGNIALRLATSKSLAQLAVRVCTCTHCIAQGARYTSDPAGSVTIFVTEPDKLLRYRMGHETTDFLSCGRCSVYVGAYMEYEGRTLAVINVNALRRATEFPAGSSASFDGEAPDTRLKRRSEKWTPAMLRLGESPDAAVS